MFINPLASAATLSVVFLCCLGLGITLRTSLWTTAALGLGSHVFSFAGTCWTQPLAMFFVTAANFQFIRHQKNLHVKQAIASSVFLAAAILVRPDILPLVPIACSGMILSVCKQKGTSDAAMTFGWFCLPMLGALACWFVWNWLRFDLIWILPGGNQLHLFMADRFLEGLIGQFISPGAGLVFYFPFALSVFSVTKGS